MSETYLSVVIPAYNEETNIRLGALDKVVRYLEHQSYPWEVIAVDDGSTDQTAALIDDFRKSYTGFSMIRNPHQGKAATVMTGVAKSRGSIVLFTDLDQATPIREIAKLLPWFDRGYDVVIGSRSARREGAPLWRRIMAQGFMALRSVILGLPGISDTQCGFKAFRRDAAHDIFSGLQLFRRKQTVTGSMVKAGFDIEVLYLAIKRGYRVREVPVEWHYVDTRRVNPFHDSWQAIVDLVRIRVNAARGRYEKHEVV